MKRTILAILSFIAATGPALALAEVEMRSVSTSCDSVGYVWCQQGWIGTMGGLAMPTSGGTCNSANGELWWTISTPLQYDGGGAAGGWDGWRCGADDYSVTCSIICIR